MSQSMPQMRIHLWRTTLSITQGEKNILSLYNYFVLTERTSRCAQDGYTHLGQIVKGKEVKLIGHAVPKTSYMQGQLPWIILTQLSTSVTNDHPYRPSMWQYASVELVIN